MNKEPKGRNSVIRLIFIILCTSYILSACSNSNAEDNPTKKGNSVNPIKFYNITILIDLSNRDLSTKRTSIPIRHDTTAVRIILTALRETFRSLEIKDKVMVERVHIDNANFEDFFSDNSKKFNIDMEEVYQYLKAAKKPALSIPARKTEFDKRAEELIRVIGELENKASQNNNPTGGDITQFLNEKIKYYYKADYKNVLVILTDGYEVFESNTQKNRPSEIKLSGDYPGLQILMLGLNAPNTSKNPNEISKKKKEWTDKFNSIGISKEDIEFNEVHDINLIKSKASEFIK